jgi:MFS transporter, ACS family, DAL5 transporter family protein
MLTWHSIFYIGYMIGSLVWAKLVHQWPYHTGKLIAGAILAWSTIILLTRTWKNPSP